MIMSIHIQFSYYILHCALCIANPSPDIYMYYTQRGSIFPRIKYERRTKLSVIHRRNRFSVFDELHTFLYELMFDFSLRRQAQQIHLRCFTQTACRCTNLTKIIFSYARKLGVNFLSCEQLYSSLLRKPCRPGIYFKSE